MNPVLQNLILTFCAGFGGVLCFWSVCEGDNVRLQQQSIMPLPLYKMLTTAEQEAYDTLCDVHGSNIWVDAIETVLLSCDVRQFRKLLQQLYTEGRANEPLMESMIGSAAWQAVKQANECRLHVA